MSDDRAFPGNFRVRGVGQDLGGAASSDSGDGSDLVSGGAEGGTDVSQLLGPGGSDPTYSGDSGGGSASGGGGGGGTSGGGGGGSPAASTVGSALSSLSSGNTPLIIGAVAVVGGIAGVAYLAHRKTVQGSSSRRSSRHHRR
jgi:hypothetical protein